MRRSQAPSAKRPRLEDATNAAVQALNIAQTRPSAGIALGGYLGLGPSGACSGVNLPQQSGAACSGSPCIKPLRPPLSGHSTGSQTQFKCPVPGASGGGSRGSLGLKKNYSNVTGDLLKSIQRTVFLGSGASEPATAVSELVLYDPTEHREQLRQAQREQHKIANHQHPTKAAVPADTAQTSTTGSQYAAPAAAGTPFPCPSSKPGAAAPAPVLSGQTTQQAIQVQGAQLGPLAAEQELVQHEPQQQGQLDDTEFNINWKQRTKVFADLFLVEKLRPHQREGLKFVFECLSGVRQQGIFGAVLADGMGLGKTFQTIASLYSLMTKGITGTATCKKPLILCPTSLVQNWGKELRHWLGERVTPVVVDDTRADCVKKSFQDFRAYCPPGKAPKVLVMSYPCFRMHKAEVYKMGIDVVMCDEAHFLKNGEAQITQAVSGLSAKRRLLMSGTPIQNDLSEFHAVFDLACPGLLGDIKEFNRKYEGPIQRGRDADATDKQVALGLERMTELMKLCNKFMLRRTSTVLKSLLPAKVEQVVFCKLSPLQLKLYNAFLNSKPVQALLASTAAADDTAEPGSAAAGGAPKKRKSAKSAKKASPSAVAAGDKENMAPGDSAAAAAADPSQQQQQQQEEKSELLAPLVAITALKKLCCHPDLIWEMLNKHKVAEKQRQQQQQLMQMMAAQRRVSGRAAAAGVRSYADVDGGSDSDGEGGRRKGGKRKSSGPAKGGGGGRLTGFEGTEPIFTQDVYPPYQAGKCQAFHSGKVMVLESLLKAIRASEPTDKVVLVSNYTEALDILGGMCTAQRWVSLRLDGSCSVKQRQAIVDTFNNPEHPSFVLLLSSKAGGVGLNIIGANRLVLFDPDWNPANDLQAMARVWREGQKKRVWIYRMLMAGSIEEKVLQRQLAKQGLSEALVDEVGQEVRTFSRDELRSLFRVNPSIACETHNAIKCSCDGSLEAMETCRERAAAASSSGGESDQQGVMAWAHLAKAADSPDPTWQAMTSFVRDNYVTYVFSDHVLDQVPPPQPALAATAAAATPAVGAGSKSQQPGQQKVLKPAVPAGRAAAADNDKHSRLMCSSKKTKNRATTESDTESDKCDIESESAYGSENSSDSAGSNHGTLVGTKGAAAAAKSSGVGKPMLAARAAARPPLARRASARPAGAAAVAAASRGTAGHRRNSAPAAAATAVAPAVMESPAGDANGMRTPAATGGILRPATAAPALAADAGVKAADLLVDHDKLPDDDDQQAVQDFPDNDDDWFQ